MKPEDLGIAPFEEAQDPGPPWDTQRTADKNHERAKRMVDDYAARSGPQAHTSELVRTADDVGQKVRALTATAEAIGRENAALKSVYARALATIQRLSAELFHVKRALEEVRRHRTVLFGLLVLALVLSRL